MQPLAGFTQTEIPFLSSSSSELIIKYFFLAVAVILTANFSHSLINGITQPVTMPTLYLRYSHRYVFNLSDNSSLEDFSLQATGLLLCK